MKRQFVKDLKPKTVVSDIFYVQSRELKDRRDGGQFLRFELGDKTGVIPAVMWEDIAATAATVHTGDFVLVNGVVGEYSGRQQLTISLIQPVPAHEIQGEDFLRVSRYPRDEMLREAFSYLAEVTDDHLRRLLETVFADPETVRRFQTAPGGARVHHAYLGGLLEHTLFMLRASRLIKETYPETDYPLLVTGILLHDIGKIDEYVYDKVIEHTDEGRLLGHVVMGYRRVDRAISELPDFPEERAKMVLHMILSHHGEMEFGAPKTPKFVEAYLLHMLDHLDAWVAMFREVAENNQSGRWTEYHSFLETHVFLPQSTRTPSHPPAAGENG